MLLWVQISGWGKDPYKQQKLICPTRGQRRSSAISFQPHGGARLGQRLNKQTIMLLSATHRFACTGKKWAMGKLKSLGVDSFQHSGAAVVISEHVQTYLYWQRASRLKKKIKSLLPSLRLSKKLKWAQTLPCCSVGPASVQVLEHRVVCAHKQAVALNAEGTVCAHAPTVHAGTGTRQRQTHRSQKAIPPTAQARGGSGAGQGDGWAIREGAPGLTPAPLF